MNAVLLVVSGAYFYLNLFLGFVVLALAIIGLIQLASTRNDAFTVIDRKKENWLMLLGGASALGLLSLFVNMELLWVIAAVIVGIYWQDIRPAIKDVLGNASGSW
ncbi:DUF2516 family protein [Corynebacterium falsenii]|uniref:DUF2516 family protein n=1 Tax=Corynebacterium falsenii TaxID=108486 RepID=A0A418Q568_9CORY|nr:DUF2516 family protein [Corynebacterium falsenii]AHI03992.1 membrane protein [Corynebacterium falsenii DSM 44353]MDC7103274.1 DUF2516 family protein [Corynebacterium falsenii]RIX33693.1 DUF2516 family protein [Corynebacterium falsenii]UBI04768.1 DUF2516 family protein [Corynebacterium falsenii]UBI07257.1 DUF2516 family protein [Corynebacterium falsenii]